MGGDQTGCQCQRTSLHTAVFKESPQISTKFVGIFSFPASGGRTYCPTGVFSYTPQVPTQPPPTAPAAHLNTPNSILLLLGTSPLCRWAQSHLLLGDFIPGSSRRAGDLGQLQPHGHLEILQDPAPAGTSPQSWYSPPLLVRGHLAASGRATSKMMMMEWWSTSDTGMQGM